MNSILLSSGGIGRAALQSMARSGKSNWSQYNENRRHVQKAKVKQKIQSMRWVHAKRNLKMFFHVYGKPVPGYQNDWVHMGCRNDAFFIWTHPFCNRFAASVERLISTHWGTARSASTRCGKLSSLPEGVFVLVCARCANGSGYDHGMKMH